MPSNPNGGDTQPDKHETGPVAYKRLDSIVEEMESIGRTIHDMFMDKSMDVAAYTSLMQRFVKMHDADYLPLRQRLDNLPTGFSAIDGFRDDLSSPEKIQAAFEREKKLYETPKSEGGLAENGQA